MLGLRYGLVRLGLSLFLTPHLGFGLELTTHWCLELLLTPHWGFGLLLTSHWSLGLFLTPHLRFVLDLTTHWSVELFLGFGTAWFSLVTWSLLTV